MTDRYPGALFAAVAGLAVLCVSPAPLSAQEKGGKTSFVMTLKKRLIDRSHFFHATQ